MTNTGLINSFNEINNFLIFLRNEYAAAAQEGNLTSGDLTAAVRMNETATTEAIDASKDLLEREFEKIQEEVGIDKEILAALPKNGIRANSKYAQRIEDVAAKYYAYKDKLYDEQKANIYKDISSILKKMGISPEKDGFHYLRKAIYECYLNPSLLLNINNNIYPILSNTFNININSIIRSINYAIETGYTKSNYEYEEKLFSNTIDIDKGKPTTVSFISIIVDELLLLHNITYY